jgi:hypothetical protein
MRVFMAFLTSGRFMVMSPTRSSPITTFSVSYVMGIPLRVIPASAKRVSGNPAQTATSTSRWIPALRFAWRE